jgi:hypothetical protein
LLSDSNDRKKPKGYNALKANDKLSAGCRVSRKKSIPLKVTRYRQEKLFTNNIQSNAETRKKRPAYNTSMCRAVRLIG